MNINYLPVAGSAPTACNVEQSQGRAGGGLVRVAYRGYLSVLTQWGATLVINLTRGGGKRGPRGRGRKCWGEVSHLDPTS